MVTIYDTFNVIVHDNILYFYIRNLRSTCAIYYYYYYYYSKQLFIKYILFYICLMLYHRLKASHHGSTYDILTYKTCNV